jgi:hypothetical protein
LFKIPLNNEQTLKTMKDRNIKQILFGEGIKEEGKGQ